MTSAFGGQRSIQLSYGCWGIRLTGLNVLARSGEHYPASLVGASARLMVRLFRAGFACVFSECWAPKRRPPFDLTDALLILRPMTDMTDIVVAAFYHFTRFDEPAALRESLLASLSTHNLNGLKGTVLLAGEGVNGTLAGSRTSIDAALRVLRALPGCGALEHKESHAEDMPFYRLKVRLKKEIVAMGVAGVDPSATVGTYVAPEDWNDLITDPDTVVIDARNDYEVETGTFDGALNPQTKSFRDLPHWLDKHRGELENKKVAMFCTGGIRCEKATSYLKAQGFDNVFHLKGGILKYLEHVPEAESRWQGECFVFDYRVTVKHGLALGDHEMCHACRRPVDAAGRASPHYVSGVSCDYCIYARTEKQREGYAERQSQVALAKARGEAHVGATFAPKPKKPSEDFLC